MRRDVNRPGLSISNYVVISENRNTPFYLSLPVEDSAFVTRARGRFLRVNEDMVSEEADFYPLLCVVDTVGKGEGRAIPFISRRCATQIISFNRAERGSISLCAMTKGLGDFDHGLVLSELYLENGRSEDLAHDPLGGYLTEKAIREYDALAKCQTAGVVAEVPLCVFELPEMSAEGHSISLLVKGARTNLRLDKFPDLCDSDLQMLTGMGITPQTTSRRVMRGLGLCHREAQISHGSPYEDNISAVGELCDFEYSEECTLENAWQDHWYAMWALSEVFGPSALDVTSLMAEYIGHALDAEIPREVASVASAEACRTLASWTFESQLKVK